MLRAITVSLVLWAGSTQTAIVADPGFGNAGSVAINTPQTLFYATPKLGVLPDGRILVANLGDLQAGSLAVLHVARLDSAGVPDVNFGNAGVSTIGLSSEAWTSTTLKAMAAQADGGALALVNLSRHEPPAAPVATTLLARLGANGRLAPAFNSGNVLALANLSGASTRLVAHGSGTLILASAAIEPDGYSVQIARVREDGVPDPGFATGGTLSLLASPHEALDLMPLPDGGFQVLFLQPRQGTQASYNFWRRYRADGSLNTAYGNSGDLALQLAERAIISHLSPVQGGYRLGTGDGIAQVLLDRQGQIVRRFSYRVDTVAFNAQPLGDKILLSGEQRFGGVPPPRDGTYLHVIDTAGNADLGFGDLSPEGWRPPDQPNDSFAVAADAQARILLARRDQAGLRVFRYLDVRGVPAGVPVPAIGPLGVGLMGLGLLWLARRRLRTSR